MSKHHNTDDDIRDDEIRIIAPDSPENQPPKWAEKKSGQKGLWLLVSLLIVIGLVICGLLIGRGEEPTPAEEAPEIPEEIIEPQEVEESAIVSPTKSSVAVVDTVINRHGLRIFEPRNATASLTLGEGELNDSTIILATRAADIRGDNGQILGTFVLHGELKSRGDSKAGYCAIIDGRPTIGIADSTPLLEQALTENGYFFRQFPLVVGGQAVENSLKNKAIRKSLAEIGGKICVIVSREKLTFKEFTELLTEAGVRNAIYLCGGDSYGFYTDSEGQRQRIDKEDSKIGDQISFIIWR